MITVAVTVQPTVIDRFGERVADGDARTVSGCVLVPREVERDEVAAECWTIHAPRESPIHWTDWIIMPGGLRYEIEGGPLFYTDPFGGPNLSSTVVHVKRVTG